MASKKRLRKVVMAPAAMMAAAPSVAATAAPSTKKATVDMKAELAQIMGLNRLRTMRIATTGMQQP